MVAKEKYISPERKQKDKAELSKQASIGGGKDNVMGND